LERASADRRSRARKAAPGYMIRSRLHMQRADRAGFRLATPMDWLAAVAKLSTKSCTARSSRPRDAVKRTPLNPFFSRKSETCVLSEVRWLRLFAGDGDGDVGAVDERVARFALRKASSWPASALHTRAGEHAFRHRNQGLIEGLRLRPRGV
jgi:hypothetical protein